MSVGFRAVNITYCFLGGRRPPISLSWSGLQIQSYWIQDNADSESWTWSLLRSQGWTL